MSGAGLRVGAGGRGWGWRGVGRAGGREGRAGREEGRAGQAGRAFGSDNLLEADYVLVIENLENLDLADRGHGELRAAARTAGRRHCAAGGGAAERCGGRGGRVGGGGGSVGLTPSFSLSIRTRFSATISPVSLFLALYTCLRPFARRSGEGRRTSPPPLPTPPHWPCCGYRSTHATYRRNGRCGRRLSCRGNTFLSLLSPHARTDRPITTLPLDLPCVERTRRCPRRPARPSRTSRRSSSPSAPPSSSTCRPTPRSGDGCEVARAVAALTHPSGTRSLPRSTLLAVTSTR